MPSRGRALTLHACDLRQVVIADRQQQRTDDTLTIGATQLTPEHSFRLTEGGVVKSKGARIIPRGVLNVALKGELTPAFTDDRNLRPCRNTHGRPSTPTTSPFVPLMKMNVKF